MANEEQKPKEAIGFRGGMPYEADVRRLDEAYPVESLQEGRVISHEDLEKLLRYKAGSGRYYGVIDSWRSQNFRKYDLFLDWERSKGLKVLAPHERLHKFETGMVGHLKLSHRNASGLSTVDRDRLNDDGKKRLDADMRAGMIIRTAEKDARKQIAVPIPANRSLPPRPTKQLAT